MLKFQREEIMRSIHISIRTILIVAILSGLAVSAFGQDPAKWRIEGVESDRAYKLVFILRIKDRQ